MAGDAPEATGGIAVGGFRTFRYPDRAGDGVAETSSVSASEGVSALSATPTDPSTSLRAGPSASVRERRRQTPKGLLVGVSAVSASDMPISRPGAGGPLPGFCNSRNFRKRYANGRWLGVAGVGRKIARARIVAAWDSFAPHRDPEIDVRCGRVQCHRAMALREIIEASEHDADPVCVVSADIRHNIARERQGKDGQGDCTSGAQDNSCVPAGTSGNERMHCWHCGVAYLPIPDCRRCRPPGDIGVSTSCGFGPMLAMLAGDFAGNRCAIPYLKIIVRPTRAIWPTTPARC
jgi:hypothetical protein